MKKKKKILITGVAGFIGFSLARKILQSKNFDVVDIDNLNSDIEDLELEIDELP